MAKDSSGPVVLITGTSTGVGLHTAIAFARAGYVTVATMRDTSKKKDLLAAAKAAGVKVKVEKLDVQRKKSIAACVEKVIRKHGGIDVLVNNAGAGFLGSLEQTTDADLDRTMGVNFFGVWRMTKAVFPHMRERGAGRIISVTSVGGLIGQPFNDAYCAAKFAVEGMMESLAPLAQRLGVQVSLIEPGPINTEFVNSVRSVSDLAAYAPPYDEIVQKYMGASTNVFAQYGQTGADIAEVILAAATAETPDFRYITSDFAKQVVAPKVVDPTGNSVVSAFAARLQ
ncbi:MAG: SDR family oxidoreductase [Phenylobacterium sp.]|uniref:SDR family oxidoreductase n=1 Tax=Phenylobacterium sp. TaxID=1871053 RepID=UPI001B65AB78|nr:SDR family oxidoreductase [Phenylobacterium sp.]MBP7815475.1 SDR family oxidoreductase [Phenylobacterium sp.]